jgi:hypothetical protein
VESFNSPGGFFSLVIQEEILQAAWITGILSAACLTSIRKFSPWATQQIVSITPASPNGVQ